MDPGDLRAVEDTAREDGTVPEVLTPDTLLAAYVAGMFPMGLGEDGGPPIGWWAPRRRGVLRPGELHVSHSLRKSLRRFDTAVDTRFEEVVRACADPSRSGAWITEGVVRSYVALHAAGHAHSFEVFEKGTGELVGGLYGVARGGVFAGESMFHRATDASKVALVALVRLLDAVDDDTPWLVDTQWQTSHLASLGVSEISGAAYLRALARARTGTHSQHFLSE
ncbi:leucyl/phenylalanyl-tRNA--protein transferase [Brevibacterium litoralis]|uniref:leucyl/phenylalanyl-tRNA--protein transferase n=1 Tax=Brevibacterium litoralis TaxID=3138935 RepID=UPI0032EDFA68